MEGICGIVSFESNSHDFTNKIDLMAGCLSDGEALEISKIVGNNLAFAAGGWKAEQWKPIVFAAEDERTSLVGFTDVVNFEKLAAEFKIPVNNTAALVAAAYQNYGDNWASKLEGTFSIIVFDKMKNKLVAVIDPIGIRPLYWHKSDNTFYFSSRLDSIKKAVPSLEIDNQSIYTFLRYEMIPAPGTIYKNVYKLEPGLSLVAKKDGHSLQKYWDISVRPKLSVTEKDASQQVYKTINDSVAVMTNDLSENENIACFLSGGTDSSSICGLLSKMTPDPVSAYSIGFPENGFDEMHYARVAAKAFNLDHHEFYVNPDDVLNALPLLAGAYDEPFGNSSIIPAYFCAHEAAKNNVHYLLAGDGGDEVFGGNERYSTQQVFRNYFKLPALLRQAFLEPLLLNRLERLPLSIFQKAGSYVRRAKMPEAQRIHSYRYITDEEMFHADFLQSIHREEADNISAQHFNRLQEAELLDRHLYLDMKMTIADNDIVKVTRMCQLAHVRVRYPLLDRPVVDLGFRLPVDLKLRGTKGLRYIFKKAFDDLLPQEILNKEKHGFGLPVAVWLRKNDKIKKFAYDLLFDKKHLQRGYFQPEFVKKLWQLQLEDSTSYYGSVVWLMIMLEAWHRIHLENETLEIS